MDEKKYVAYVGTYTHGSSVGIHLFDLDVENGGMTERKVIPINNPSYIKMSHNGRFLYSIADEGVRSFTVLPDGDLEPLNCASIEGMRGCYLSTDKDDQYLIETEPEHVSQKFLGGNLLYTAAPRQFLQYCFQ